MWSQKVQIEGNPADLELLKELVDASESVTVLDETPTKTGFDFRSPHKAEVLQIVELVLSAASAAGGVVAVIDAVRRLLAKGAERGAPVELRIIVNGQPHDLAKLSDAEIESLLCSD